MLLIASGNFLILRSRLVSDVNLFSKIRGFFFYFTTFSVHILFVFTTFSGI